MPPSSQTRAPKRFATQKESFAPLRVRFSGPDACFTRSEFSAERVSYPVPTPSACRGMLESIYWKPQFRWHIREIHVLSPIRFLSTTRRELTRAFPVPTLEADGTAILSRPLALPEADGTLRRTSALRDVAYVVVADAVPHNGSKAEEAKHRDIFRRRMKREELYRTPYLGMEEFSADVSLPSEKDVPIALDLDLGMMLFDFVHPENGRGPSRPLFFHAQLQQGVLRVPAHLYEPLRKDA